MTHSCCIFLNVLKVMSFKDAFKLGNTKNRDSREVGPGQLVFCHKIADKEWTDALWCNIWFYLFSSSSLLMYTVPFKCLQFLCQIPCSLSDHVKVIMDYTFPVKMTNITIMITSSCRHFLSRGWSFPIHCDDCLLVLMSGIKLILIDCYDVFQEVFIHISMTDKHRMKSAYFWWCEILRLWSCADAHFLGNL